MTPFLDFLVAFLRIVGWVWMAVCLALGFTLAWFVLEGRRERRRDTTGRTPPSRRLFGLPVDADDQLALEQEHEPTPVSGQAARMVEDAEAFLAEAARRRTQ